MARKDRVWIWVNKEEQAEIKARAAKVNLDPSVYLRDDIFRRVRTHHDTQILDEIHRVRVVIKKDLADLNRVGGLLKLISVQLSDKNSLTRAC